jgi:hypothetical protein
MIRSKYFSESELQRFVTETEQEVDLRAAQREEQQRLQAITDFIANPANAHILDADPMVQKIRAHGTPAQPLRSAAPIGTPGNPIPFNARFDPSHLKHQPVQISSIKDPYIR